MLLSMLRPAAGCCLYLQLLVLSFSCVESFLTPSHLQNGLNGFSGLRYFHITGAPRLTVPLSESIDANRERATLSRIVVEDFALLITPAAMAGIAFSQYKDTSVAFHNFVEVASQNTWSPVDGGAYLTDLITPALNGPVTTVISILFATLVSMTVSNLLTRQNTMARALAEIIDDARRTEIHIENFPEPFRSRADSLVDSFVRGVFEDAAQKKICPVSLRSRQELGSLLKLLNQLSLEPNAPGMILGEAYAAVNRIIDHRSNLIAAYQTRFPIWHYGNLAILALAICVIFLMLTDKSALLFLGGFQLRMCWSMLIGTFAMLAVVIYDLNTPLSGVFKVQFMSRSINKTCIIPSCSPLFFL